METPLKYTSARTLASLVWPGLLRIAAASALLVGSVTPAHLPAQTAPAATPPPSSDGIFPLKDVHRGLQVTAWTVFSGSTPEPMDAEVLGVLRGARGPGQDMILIQLRGSKPEYTGVVAGMSGSPVYVGNRLMGSLSFRIGQFSKDPIAGVTPIEQMLEIRDMPITPASLPGADKLAMNTGQTSGLADLFDPRAPMQPIETPLVMSGFAPEAIRLWQKQMAGTGLDMVAAGGLGSSGGAGDSTVSTVIPGSAVSAELVRGDMEIAATCTVTYIDPKQLLACGHPILQAGPVSLPMTATEVLATLASPMNAFKIVNTGATIGAFTEDRASAIRGVFGAQARMIPVQLAIHGPEVDKIFHIEVLDQQALTAQALMITIFNSLLQSNSSTEETSYHLTGTILVGDYPPSPLDVWSSGGEGAPAPLQLALVASDRFSKLYSNSGRKGSLKSIDLKIEAVPRRVRVDLESARLISGNIVHAGDTVMVEATLRPWQQPTRNVRIPVKLPARLGPGNIRLMISDAGTLDRTLDQPRMFAGTPDMDSVLAQARRIHPADRFYISLLVPETQAGIRGQTLSSLPLSVANTLEPQRASQEVILNGESAELAADLPASGLAAGLQILNCALSPAEG